MSRLIDADALLKFVEDRYEITWESDTYEGGIKDACSDIIEKIDNMPTIEPEPHWIPCSERMPKEKQDVLLAFRHNMVVGFWEDILNDGGVTWYANSGDGWFTGTEDVDSDGIPTAWMPLPEPYIEDKDGN